MMNNKRTKKIRQPKEQETRNNKILNRKTVMF